MVNGCDVVPRHLMPLGSGARRSARLSIVRLRWATRWISPAWPDAHVDFTMAHAEAPWRSVRNRMAHGHFHFDIKLDAARDTVLKWRAELLKQLPAVHEDGDGSHVGGVLAYPPATCRRAR